MSIQDILTASAELENDNVLDLGINYAYDTPPEVLTDLPVAIRFFEGAAQMSASLLLGRYNIYHFKIEVHFPRGVLQEAVALALPVIEAYQTLYANNLSIRGECDVSGFREPACEGPLLLRYKDATTIGVIFYMWAKEMLDDIEVNL